jgi:hypothetical protein
MKRCSKCGRDQPLENFYRAKGSRDGLRGDCKACFAARARARYPEVRDKAIARAKQWQIDNRERHLENLRKRYQRPEVKRRERDTYLQRKHGITVDEYEAMFVEQGGGCAICAKPPRADISLHVDHDHATGRRRGLLCFSCNNALGNAGEDVERLLAFVDYLATHAEREPEIDERLAALKVLAGR